MGTGPEERERHVLVVNDAGRADELVDLGVALPAQVAEVPVSLLERGLQSCCDVTAHVSHSLEPRHLISDGEFAGKKIRLLGTHAVRLQAHELGQGRKLGSQLVVELGMEVEQLWIGGAWRCGGRREGGRLVVEEVGRGRLGWALGEGRGRGRGGRGSDRAGGVDGLGGQRRAIGRGAGCRGWALGFGVEGGRAGEEVLHGLEERGEMACLEGGQWRTRGGTGAHLGLAEPVLHVLDADPAAQIDVSARADEHVLRRHDIGDRRAARVVARDPDRDGDVVGRAPERDGQ